VVVKKLQFWKATNPRNRKEQGRAEFLVLILSYRFHFFQFFRFRLDFSFTNLGSSKFGFVGLIGTLLGLNIFHFLLYLHEVRVF